MPGRPGEARDRVFGVVGESLRVGGDDLGAASPKNEVLRSDQKVSYLDHFSLQHVGDVSFPSALFGSDMFSDRHFFALQAPRLVSYQ